MCPGFGSEGEGALAMPCGGGVPCCETLPLLKGLLSCRGSGKFHKAKPSVGYKTCTKAV